jgi:hypothetical protein
MANYRKSFNLRNGVQVDDDNFIVNSNGLVGVGTSVPTEILDIRGTTKVVGLITATSATISNLLVPGIGTFTSLTDGTVTISSGIITSSVGVATFYGDGSGLINIPTSQWVDVNTGIGITSIYAAGAVGVATNYPYYYFQVGGSPDTSSGVGFNSTGDIKVSGIVTANAFVGDGGNITALNADNISTGTISTSRLPSNIIVSGIITAGSFVGNLTGTASTANGITTTSIISVSGASIGVATVTNNLLVNQKVGVGTDNPTTQVYIRQSGISSVHIQSVSNEASISVARSDSSGKGVGRIRFGNSNLSYVYSTDQSLDIINYDDGNVNYYLQYGSAGVGTGNFNWIYGQNPNTSLMTLTYDGKLGINQANPISTLDVVGTSTVTGSSYVGGASTIAGNLTVGGSLSVTGTILFNSQLVGTLGVSTSTSPTSYSLQVGGNPDSINGVGISSSGNVKASGTVTATTISATAVNSTYANISGIITASSFGNGTGTANLSNINSESLNVSNTASISTVFATTELVLPTYTNAERTGLSTSTGSVIFNTDAGKFQGYTGTGWVDFH